ncbi:MAG: DUF2341 domain-containing protein, partial [Myxococcota bacterium]
NMGRDEALDDFPVLVFLNTERVSYSDFAGGGRNMLFLDEDRITVLPHEIEVWDPEGESLIWVKVPRIDAASSSDSIYLLYGDDTLDNPSRPAEVWTDRFEGVYHFASTNSTTSTFPDSTSYGRDGTVVDQPLAIRNGILGNALYFAPNEAGYATLGTNDAFALQVGRQITVELWFEPIDVIDGGHYNLYQQQSTLSCPGIRMRISPDSRIEGTVESGDSCASKANATVTTVTARDGRWYQAALTLDYTTAASIELCTYARRRSNDDPSAIFECSSERVPSPVDIDGAVYLGIIDPPDGAPDSGQARFTGKIDELRISSTLRSPQWIDAQHRSMKDAFITYRDSSAP